MQGFTRRGDSDARIIIETILDYFIFKLFKKKFFLDYFYFLDYFILLRLFYFIETILFY